MSNLGDSFETGELVTYTVVDDFSLLLNYETPGTFDSIKIKAHNAYKKATHTQFIEFKKPVPPPPPPPPPPPTEGLKWYIVMIIVLVVLIIAGAAYGLYRYVRAKREKKSVSLLT